MSIASESSPNLILGVVAFELGFTLTRIRGKDGNFHYNNKACYV